MKFVYAIYKGDVFIDLGLAEELSKKLGVTSKYIKYLASPANLRRNKGNQLVAIRIGTDSDEDIELEEE